MSHGRGRGREVNERNCNKQQLSAVSIRKIPVLKICRTADRSLNLDGCISVLNFIIETPF